MRRIISAVVVVCGLILVGCVGATDRGDFVLNYNSEPSPDWEYSAELVIKPRKTGWDLVVTTKHKDSEWEKAMNETAKKHGVSNGPSVVSLSEKDAEQVKMKKQIILKFKNGDRVTLPVTITEKAQ